MYLYAALLFSDTYLTIARASEGLYKDRGSKFLAYAYPVRNEQEIKERQAELRKEHASARHHCYAWRLGPDKLQYRANDDGEPSNTAGKPILGQIQSKDLTNILIVVVRYFGGTLLGVGGLIQAYREAAADALQQAEIIEEHIRFEYEMNFAFEQMNEVMRVLKDQEAKILEQGYTDNCLLRFSLRKQHSEKAESLLQQIPNSQLRYLKTH